MFSLKNNKNYFDAIIIISFISILFYKAFNTELSFDEAYTFLNYSYTGDTFNIGIANNHILNSYLISLFSKVSFAEFVIRLPNLIAGIIYGLVVLKMLKDRDFKYLGYAILLTNPYLFDFFAIARGYGLSTLFLFLSSYFYLNGKDEYNLKSFLFIILSTLSYHTTVVFLIVFWIFKLKITIKNLKSIVFLALNSVISLVIFLNIYILFNITRPGKPLYGIDELSIFDLLFGSFGFVALYINKNLFFILFVNILFYIPVFVQTKFNKKQKLLFFISYLSIILIYVIPIFIGRPFPLLRTVLPFFSPVLLLIYESIVIIFKNQKRSFSNKITLIVFLILTSNIIFQIDMTETIDWKDDFSKKQILQLANDSCEYLMPYSELGPVGQYYRLINNEVYLSCFDNK